MAALVGCVAAPAGATTMIRQSLSDLVAGHRTIVVGEVLDTTSYWSRDGSYILTDVRVAARDVLKGSAEDGSLTLTLMGGSVGDFTALIVAGPELVPGQSYVLFVKPAGLPGAPGSRTIGELAQGAFDIVHEGGRARAISQSARIPLLPDERGISEPPGGKDGLPLDNLIRSIRELAGGSDTGGR